MTARALALPVLAAALLAGGCKHPPVAELHVQGPLDAWGIAVYPVAFRFPVSPYQSYERARTVAERVSTLTGRLVYGPGEFQVSRPDDDDASSATNLVSALKCSKARRPDRLLVLRLWVEQRITSGSAVVYDKAGKARAARTQEDVDVVLHAELLNVGTAALVAEIQGIARADPLKADAEKDPYPDVTRLTDVLVEALLRTAGLLLPKPLSDGGLKLVAVPGPAMRFALPDAESLRAQLDKLDPLEQDSRLMAVWHQRDPTDNRQRMRIFRSAQHGLVVLEAKDAALKAGLAENDLLLEADGEPLTGRHVLDRHLAAGPVQVKYKRFGDELTTTLAR